MNIILKADAEFEDVLPAGAQNGEVRVSAKQNASLTDLLAVTSLKSDETYLTAVNDTIIVKSMRQGKLLEDNDIVMILAPLRGG